MTDIKRLLQDADPLRDDQVEGLSQDEAQRMRRAMLAALDEPQATFTLWHRPWALALAVVVVLIGLGGVAGDGRIGSDRAPIDELRATAAANGSSDDRRQLQFATPGGTRIIWIFDENLRLQESMK
jgi:hypothetical protein